VRHDPLIAKSFGISSKSSARFSANAAVADENNERGASLPRRFCLSPRLIRPWRKVSASSAGAISERKRTEVELRRQRQDLAHVRRVATMGELATSLAHELNQPLTAIRSNGVIF